MCAAEKIAYDEQGLEALVFTAEGDLRHALNNLQSTFAGECCHTTSSLQSAHLPRQPTCRVNLHASESVSCCMSSTACTSFLH